MKKTILTLCLTALVALPLVGCSGDNTGDRPGGAPSPSPLPSIGAGSAMEDGREDLAGPDGIVGGDSHTDSAGDTAPGRSQRSALERVGDGIRDTVDDIGQGMEDVLDDMGRDARNAADQIGRSARDMGQAAQRNLQ